MASGVSATGGHDDKRNVAANTQSAEGDTKHKLWGGRFASGPVVASRRAQPLHWY